jgi:hypothetical protein
MQMAGLSADHDKKIGLSPLRGKCRSYVGATGARKLGLVTSHTECRKGDRSRGLVATLFVADCAAPGVRGGFFEARVASQENEIHAAGGAVALLGDN